MAVSTHGPSGVTATVCSQCADCRPSWVTTVQPSSSSSTCGDPSVAMGSTASTMPTSRTIPRPGPPGATFGTYGGSCIARPIPWPV